jgi:hypothetical protein
LCPYKHRRCSPIKLISEGGAEQCQAVEVGDVAREEALARDLMQRAFKGVNTADFSPLELDAVALLFQVALFSSSSSYSSSSSSSYAAVAARCACVCVYASWERLAVRGADAAGPAAAGAGARALSLVQHPQDGCVDTVRPCSFTPTEPRA